MRDSEKIKKNALLASNPCLFVFLRVLWQNSEYVQKSSKHFENQEQIEIHEFLVLQVLGLRDSERIWNKCIFGPNFVFSVFLRVLSQNSEYFQRIFKHQEQIEINEFVVLQVLGLRDSERILKKCIFGPKPFCFCIFEGT